MLGVAQHLGRRCCRSGGGVARQEQLRQSGEVVGGIVTGGQGEGPDDIEAVTGPHPGDVEAPLTLTWPRVESTLTL